MRPLVFFSAFVSSNQVRIVRALAAVVIALSLSAVWLDAQKNHYVPCVENCGENFLVFKYVQNYRLYGFKYGLLEDHATSPEPDRKPYLYTHNANLPGTLFALMDAAGLHELWQKQLLILAVHGAGLAMVFLATSHLSGSIALGFVTLLLFCLNYNLVFNFAMNPLRAWHWLALFGLLYFSVRVAETLRADRASVLGFLAFAGIAFGLGYDFFAISATIALLAALLWMPRPVWSRNSARIMILLFVLLAVPIAIRQVQVMAVLGTEFWIHDIGYSLISKIPALGKIFATASSEDVAQYYLSRGVVRFSPPDAAALATLWPHLKDLVRYILLPVIGLLTLAVSLLACAAAVLYLALGNVEPIRARMGRWLTGGERIVAAGTSRMIFALAAGSALGISIFPFHNVQIYVKHLAPLLAAPLFVCKAALIVFLIAILRRAPWRKVRIIAAVAILGVVTDHIVVELDYMRSKTPYDMGWISEVKSRADSVFAISWMPTAVSVFTNRDVVSFSAQQQTRLLERIKAGRSPVENNSDFTPALALPGTGSDVPVRPDYWIYFPIESPFDNPVPDCSTDYLTSMISRVMDRRKNKAVAFAGEWVLPAGGTVRPGDYVVFGGQIQGVRDKVPELTLRTDQELEYQLAFNCRTNTYVGWIRTPAAKVGEHAFVVGTQSPSAASSARFRITAREDAIKLNFSLPSDIVAWPKPSADVLASQYPEIPIAARGPGWVLFDLRPLYRESKDMLNSDLKR